MKKLPQLFALFAALILVSCQTKNKSATEGGLITIPVDITTAKAYDFYDIIDKESVELIPLETTDESMLGRLTAVRVANGKFYLKEINKLKVFDEKGGHLLSLDKAGKGPEEYARLDDIYIDDEDNVFILDSTGKAIIKYDPKGRFAAKIDLADQRPMAFNKIDDDLWSLYSVMPLNENRNRLVYFSENSTEVREGELPLTEDQMNWLHTFDFNTFSNGSIIRPSFQDTIYNVSRDGIEPMIVLDALENRLPQRYLGDNYEDIRAFLESIPEKYFLNYFQLHLNDEYICFQTYPGNKRDELYFITSNLKNGETRVVKELINPLGIKLGETGEANYSIYPKARCDEFFYSVIDPDIILDWHDATNGDIPEALKGITENSNPVIMKFKYSL